MKTDSVPRRPPWLRLLLAVAIVAGIVLVFRFTPLSISDLTPERIRDFIRGFGPLAPLVFVLVYAARAVVLVIPVGIMSLAGGLAFGKWLGTLYILIGATAGSCISFLIARYLGRGFVEKLGVMKKGRLKKLDEGVEKNGFRAILFMRLVPLFQYDAVNFGSGLSRMKFRDYALGTLIGMAPGGFVNAMLGSSLDNVVSAQFFIALGLFVLIMLVPTIYRKVKKRHPPSKEPEKPAPHAAAGHCPGCGEPVGWPAVLGSWDRLGRFTCASCGGRLRFAAWLGMAVVLAALFFGVERLVTALLRLDIPILYGFLAGTGLSLVVMLVVPALWKIRADRPGRT